MGKSFKLSITSFDLAPSLISKKYAKIDEYLQSTCDYLEQFRSITLARTLTKRPSAFYNLFFYIFIFENNITNA